MAVGTRLSWTNGLDIGTSGSAVISVPVDPPPATAVIPAQARIWVRAIESVTQDGTDFKPSGPSAEKPYVRHRIVVGGKDVTYFRGAQTPFPTYALQSPLLWGAGSIAFPQIHAAFETPGSGDLSWLKKHATVKVQRVDEDGEIVAGGDQDFVGFIADFQKQGRTLTCTLGGQASGRAAMQYRPPPIFPGVVDIGTQIMQTVQHSLRLPVANEPTTGIEMLETGGGSQLDFLTDLLAKSTERDGDQWTVMPNSDGRYRMFQKDTETIDATVYIDGSNVEQDLRRDFSQEPNRVWVQGVGPDGKRILFGIFPGLVSVDRAFGGTTLHPGDSGDDVTAMIWRLLTVGALSQALGVTWTTDSDDPVTQAIKDIQEDAGLTVNGDVNAATWRAIFRGDAGSLIRSKIKPAAQWDYTAALLIDATGNVIGKNPKYQRGKLLVDRVLSDMVGLTRPQDKKFAKRELVDENGPNWQGTITVHTGAVIDGEHNPGDPLTSDLVRNVRSLKPGQNLWVPNFEGGTLFHISGVNMSQTAPGVLRAELAVDTRARDTMPLWEIIRRDRRSKHLASMNPMALNRRSGMVSDQATYDGSVFGIVERTFCPANQWTVMRTAGGRSGTLQTIDIKCEDGAAAFGLWIGGKVVDGDWMDRWVGDPFADGFKDKVSTNTDNWQEKRGLIDIFGDAEQPCGYWPRSHTNEDGETDAPITGRFKFDAGATYQCVGKPWLCVAVRPDRDTWVQGGRILELLLDDATS